MLTTVFAVSALVPAILFYDSAADAGWPTTRISNY
jgi:hypothetical protein